MSTISVAENFWKYYLKPGSYNVYNFHLNSLLFLAAVLQQVIFA